MYDEKLITPLLVSVFSLSVGIWAWLMRRWVAKVDVLHKDIESLRLQAAIRDERLTHMVGAIDTLRKTVQEQAESIGALTRMVDKMWSVLEAQGKLEKRHSDEVLSVRRKP